ncbi:MAG: hypothetical protein LBE09_06355 [Christensenellaceae bacterium]|jgi:hypothetical protein|nr:hypothetical protein [Christensenellaceae bacterium]
MKKILFLLAGLFIFVLSVTVCIGQIASGSQDYAKASDIEINKNCEYQAQPLYCAVGDKGSDSGSTSEYYYSEELVSSTDDMDEYWAEASQALANNNSTGFIIALVIAVIATIKYRAKFLKAKEAGIVSPSVKVNSASVSMAIKVFFLVIFYEILISLWVVAAFFGLFIAFLAFYTVPQMFAILLFCFFLLILASLCVDKCRKHIKRKWKELDIPPRIAFQNNYPGGPNSHINYNGNPPYNNGNYPHNNSDYTNWGQYPPNNNNNGQWNNPSNNGNWTNYPPNNYNNGGGYNNYPNDNNGKNSQNGDGPKPY